MGLLTDPNHSEGGLFGRIALHATAISWFTFSLGVAFIFVMPHPDFSHKTYFSENALLPGLVKGDYVDNGLVASVLEDLRFESKKYDNSLPYPWLEAKFRQMGLEVYTHDFTLQFPLGPDHKRSNFTGKNVYAILRAPRASSTESLVFSVPYRPPLTLEPNTDVSVALLIALASFFRLQNYWAKDIIFLITQHEQLGMQAWLEAYHQVGSGFLDHGDLEARAGSIQAAINLEVTTEKISHVNVKIEGLNGQLPNLDLVNLIYRLCMREGLHQMFQGVEDHPRPDSWKGYSRSLRTLLAMGMKQATGMPTGNHGLFHRFGIEAVTVEGVLRKRASARAYAVSDSMGRVLEGVFRSLNNLLERFHQSFFFYLLPSTSRYVSIGMYMPGFGLLAVGLVLSALAIWFQLQSENVASLQNKNETKDEQSGETQVVPFSTPPDFFGSLPLFFVAHLMGLILFHLPQPASIFGDQLELPPEDAVGVGIAAFVISSAMYPLLPSFSVSNWRMLKCIVLLELAAVLFTLSLSNFGLAYFVVVFYVPAALLAYPRQGGSRISSILRSIYILAVNPLMLIHAICSYDTLQTFSDKSLLDILPLSLDATKRALMYSVTDGYIYGNFNFGVACVFIVPCWTLLWMVKNA